MALLVICGPTAVGKTAAAIAVAGRLGGEIVCADSRTIYRGMDIGTAKPTSAERARVAHHLLDIANPDQVVTLATYGELAMAAIARVRANGRVPILTGGAGVFIPAAGPRVLTHAAGDGGVGVQGDYRVFAGDGLTRGCHSALEAEHAAVCETAIHLVSP